VNNSRQWIAEAPPGINSLVAGFCVVDARVCVAVAD